jgi:lipopolysaccharide/colanic/teichoic acid biosynthesis glycosyltransferase
LSPSEKSHDHWDDAPVLSERAEKAKRVLDVVGALCLIIATLPALLLAMLAIVLTSNGPVIFRQRRVGLRGKEFIIFKLRTMREGEPPRTSEPRIFEKVQGDPRVTLAGHVIRKFSFDELPQLFNILRGDMSLVGPRPLLLRDMHRFPPGRARRRFEMRPGLTGLWQVSGRNLLPDEERIRLDLEYVERWSPWMDIKIILRTPLVVLQGRGAF